MRKVLISILIILLIVLAYFTIFEGISLGSFEILGATGIVDLNDELTDKIAEANEKIKNDLQNKKTELSQNVKTLLENKESYYRVANVSTESEISEANTEEIYNIEYLWLRVGRHARSEGVNLRMDVMEGTTNDGVTKNLSFTVIGKYVGIIDFISSIENDSELGFRIENFNLIPDNTTSNDDKGKTPEQIQEENEKKNTLKATFNVNGIRIKIENTTQTVDGANQDGQTTPDGTNTNSVDTTSAQGVQDANTDDATTQTN